MIEVALNITSGITPKKKSCVAGSSMNHVDSLMETALPEV